MLIGGLQKTTLIDFPGRVACTVFTVGCNFRCPFCHNKDLITLKNFRNSGLEYISKKFFFEFLEKRKEILDGVCITGGEPTLQKDLHDFCKKIKSLNLAVKLDTNGSNPKIIKNLILKKLIDFVAMDVKTNFSDYEKVVSVKCRASSIKESIKLILKSNLEYELRTTVVPTIHNKKIMLKLAKDLHDLVSNIPPIGQAGKHQASRLNWVLQNFRAQNCLDSKYLKIKPFNSIQMTEILKVVKNLLPNTKIRGED